MRVNELMTTSVASVCAGQPLSEAARLMWECDCGALPVVDDTTGRVVAMITDRDICMASWSKNRSPGDISVAETMSRELYRCAPTDSVSSAEELMRSKQVRRVPVTDESGKLVGILSLADIVTESQQIRRGDGGELASAVITSTLAKICRPHGVPSSI